MVTPDSHVDSDTLEKYSMAGISNKRAARIEEHLLICEACRQSLQRTEVFISAMKSAGATLRRSPRKRTAVKR